MSTSSTLASPDARSFTRQKWFWILHSLFFLACVGFAYTQFHKSFPFVDLEVKMDRRAALRKADEIAGTRKWFPLEAARMAASFDVDSSTQNFLELEAGGPKTLKRVLNQGLYTPYTWRVRRFAEGKTNETQIRFTPAGDPYAFWMKISEDDPGAALPVEKARAIAESAAKTEWGIDLAGYRAVEAQSESRKSKRVDHTFIYERETGPDGERIGEGRYRLKLEVSGDRLSALGRYIKVPEAFQRRYSEMRSANGTIASVAGAAVALLYGLAICGFGLLWLAKRHLIEWRFALGLAGLISGLQFLERLNQLPLEWMSYDTAISTQAFALRQVAGALLGALADFVMVGVALVAGESLSRRAFPQQPQLWKLLSRDAAGTRPAIGRVVGAYLFVGFHFAWVVWVYRFGAEKLGWWNPSELLFHPDALAAYFPWLTSVSNSLHAGVWEECLFRGVPLAAAAIVGERFGRRKLWIAGAFVLQAVIFGAAHASYPTQPSYARLLELLVPSSVFGGVYLAFGLFPGILMHYVYDVALFAMPVFLSSGTVARASQVLVVAISGIPLWLALAARIRQGEWRELPERLRNRGWLPRAESADTVALAAQEAELGPAPGLGRVARRALVAAAALSLAAWAALMPLKADVPGLTLPREQALSVARQALDQRGIKLGPEWQAFATVSDEPEEQDLFVWRTSGPEIYRGLLGTYLQPPYWRVRYARFEGDLVERAEEYLVAVPSARAEEARLRHDLPEGRAGAVLEEAAARAIAEKRLREVFKLDPAKLTTVSSTHYKLPARRDWVFVWQDPSQALKLGEARVYVRVSGDEASASRRYVHAPEEWSRAERARKTVFGVLRMLGIALAMGLAFWIGFVALRDWVSGRFNARAFGAAFVAVLALGGIDRLNQFQEAAVQFSTAQPWSSQVLRYAITGLVLGLLGAAAAGVFVGGVFAPARSRSASRPAESASGLESDLLIGAAAGTILSGLGAAAARWADTTRPSWPDLSPALSSVAWLDPALHWAVFGGSLAFLMLVFPWIERHLGRRHAVLRAAGFVLLGLALGGASSGDATWSTWALSGFAVAASLGAIYELVRRTQPATLIPLMAVSTVLRIAREGALGAYAGSFGFSVVQAAGVAAIAWLAWRGLARSGVSSPRPHLPNRAHPSGSA